jgi:hypothetical protein
MEKEPRVLTYKEVLKSYNFDWNSTEELWERKESFGRISTVDVVFKSCFIIYKNKVKIQDNFIESFNQFKKIMSDNFS